MQVLTVVLWGAWSARGHQARKQTLALSTSSAATSLVTVPPDSCHTRPPDYPTTRNPAWPGAADPCPRTKTLQEPCKRTTTTWKPWCHSSGSRLVSSSSTVSWPGSLPRADAGERQMKNSSWPWMSRPCTILLRHASHPDRGEAPCIGVHGYPCSPASSLAACQNGGRCTAQGCEVQQGEQQGLAAEGHWYSAARICMRVSTPERLHAENILFTVHLGLP